MFQFMNEVEVSEINNKPRCLANHNHRILTPDSVAQQNDATRDTEIPEGLWNNAFTLFLRCHPLNKEAHEEHTLTQKADDNPDGFSRERRQGHFIIFLYILKFWAGRLAVFATT